MNEMFNNAQKFDGDISNWDVGNVETMQTMFRNAQNFNQNIGNWNVSNVKSIDNMFTDAIKFNQNLGEWQLSSLISASGMFLNSGLNCQNYDSTLLGWSINPSTPNNIYLSSVSPLVYSHPAAVSARNQLITAKNWNISGDTYDGECQSFLGTSDVKITNEIAVYPNPATEFIYVKNFGAEHFTIFDLSGRIIEKGILNNGKINIQALKSGNYILQLVSKNETKNLKFIRQ
jgi:surface protein